MSMTTFGSRLKHLLFSHIDGLRKTGDAPGHKPRLLLLVVLRILVVVVVVVGSSISCCCCWCCWFFKILVVVVVVGSSISCCCCWCCWFLDFLLLLLLLCRGTARARARAKTPLQKARGTLKRDINKKSEPKPSYLRYFFNMLKTEFNTKGMNMRKTNGIPWFFHFRCKI